MPQRSIIEDLELLVNADNILADAVEDADGDEITLTDEEADVIEETLGFFNDAVETGQDAPDIDMFGEGSEIVEARNALDRIANGNGTVEDAELALKHIAGFGRAAQQQVASAIEGQL